MISNLPSSNPTTNSALDALSGWSVAAPCSPAAGPPSPSLDLPAKVSVWGTPFARLDMQQTLALAERIIQRGKPEYFVTANLNYLMLTAQHPRLAEVNADSVAVIADGHPIVLRSRLTESPLPCRVAGSDMIVELSRLAAERGYRVFFLGAAPGVAQTAANALCHRFPTLQVAGCYSPPFRALSAAEHEEMLARIQGSRTDILFVAFGQPKGEFWIHDHLSQLGVPLSIQLGASFDFLAGTARRAPHVWRQIGCEWLYRALSDPRRLGPRYSRNAWFLAKEILRELLGRNR
ncbi:MAG: WecB/TagA/CpsF family glycosyltransferase [Planctomycetales bacterium]|nr:WecB/TagA/CpsF family glycosyltransferase [Planctomycetales bacterium]